MAQKYSYTLFDTAIFTTALAGEQALFQVAQGGDAVHTKAFTNMRGAGSLPNNESFNVKKIGVYQDFLNLVFADLLNIWLLSYLELRVNDESVLQIPLRAAAQYNGFGGHYSQAAAANGALGGLSNDGYALEFPVMIKGGVSWRVNVNQGVVTTVANIPVRVLLHGDLNRD